MKTPSIVFDDASPTPLSLRTICCLKAKTFQAGNSKSKAVFVKMSYVISFIISFFLHILLVNMRKFCSRYKVRKKIHTILTCVLLDVEKTMNKMFKLFSLYHLIQSQPWIQVTPGVTIQFLNIWLSSILLYCLMVEIELNSALHISCRFC